MKGKGYVARRVNRSYSPDFESSILLFLFSQKGRNLIQLYIYNLNEQQIGLQAVSLQKIYELKLSNSNLDGGFKEIMEDVGGEIFPDIKSFDD